MICLFNKFLHVDMQNKLLISCILTERLIVFQSFGQHGRELITSEVALRLLYVLTEKRKIAGVDLSSFEKMLENIVIKVSPLGTSVQKKSPFGTCPIFFIHRFAKLLRNAWNTFCYCSLCLAMYTVMHWYILRVTIALLSYWGR
jgi:hypothetical protein